MRDVVDARVIQVKMNVLVLLSDQDKSSDMPLSFSSPVVPGWRPSHAALRPRHPAETQPLGHGKTLVQIVFRAMERPRPKGNLCPQYLSCLTTSRSLTDKLAFDVGLQEDSTGNRNIQTVCC